MRKPPGIAIAALLALAGCGGSLFRSHAPPLSIYQLSIKAGPVGAPMAADLAVLTPRVRSGLDSDRIAALYPDRRLDNFAGARWSAPLDEMVQDLALQAFRGQARLRNVSTDASAFESGFWLEIDVADFQAEYANPASGGGSGPPTVHVHLVARVGGAGDRRILGQFDADARQPATDNRLTAIVEAYNRAADAAIGTIAADTVETLGRSLDSRRPESR